MHEKTKNKYRKFIDILDREFHMELRIRQLQRFITAGLIDMPATCSDGSLDWSEKDVKVYVLITKMIKYIDMVDIIPMDLKNKDDEYLITKFKQCELADKIIGNIMLI